MKTLIPFPVHITVTDDQITLNLSDGSTQTQGRLSGYPGNEMSDVNVDDYGKLTWTDPTGNVTEVGTLFKNVNINYTSAVAGMYRGLDELPATVQRIHDANDMLPESADLIRTITDVYDTPIAHYNGWAGFEIAGVGHVLSSHSTSGYPVRSMALATRNPTKDNEVHVWSGGSTDRWVVWEYESVISVAGVEMGNFRREPWATDYYHISVSENGVDWKEIHRVRYTEVGGYIPFDRVYVTRFLKIAPDVYKSTIELPATNFITSKSNTKVPLDINTDWYDKETTAVVETDTHFELYALFDNTPVVETFTPAKLEPDLYNEVTLDTGYPFSMGPIRILRFPEGGFKGDLPIGYKDGAFKLPVGYYEIDIEALVHNISSRDIMRVRIAATNEIIAESSETNETNRRLLPMATNNKLVFYNPYDQYVYFAAESTNTTTNLTVEHPVKETLHIRKIPYTNMTHERPGKYKYKNILAGLDTSLVISNDTLDNLFVRPGDFTTTLAVGGTHHIEFELPVPITVSGHTLDMTKGGASSYSIDAYLNGSWVPLHEATLKDTDLTYRTLWGEYEPVTASKWRITVVPTSTAYMFKQLSFHNREAFLNGSVRVVMLDPTTSTASTAAINGEVCPSTNINLRMGDGIAMKYRVDDYHNLYAAGSNVTTDFILTEVVTGAVYERSVTYAASEEFKLVMSDLPPGVYEITTAMPTFIGEFYFEKVQS